MDDLKRERVWIPDETKRNVKKRRCLIAGTEYGRQRQTRSSANSETIPVLLWLCCGEQYEHKQKSTHIWNRQRTVGIPLLRRRRLLYSASWSGGTISDIRCFFFTYLGIAYHYTLLFIQVRSLLPSHQLRRYNHDRFGTAYLAHSSNTDHWNTKMRRSCTSRSR